MPIGVLLSDLPLAVPTAMNEKDFKFSAHDRRTFVDYASTC